MARTNSRGGGCGCVDGEDREAKETEGWSQETQQGSGNQLRSSHPTDATIITLELK